MKFIALMGALVNLTPDDLRLKEIEFNRERTQATVVPEVRIRGN